MIKPINEGPLNFSKELEYKCEGCGDHGVLRLEDAGINTDNDGNPLEPIKENCPKCSQSL